MNWYELVKRYVWDDNTTPFLIGVGKLNSSQARKELFVYVLFLGILFAIVTIHFLAEAGKQPDLLAFGKAIYALSVFGGAVAFGVTKHPKIALYCASAPVVVLIEIIGNGSYPDLGTIDRYLIIGLTCVWLYYAMRAVAISRALPHMPDAGDGRSTHTD